MHGNLSGNLFGQESGNPQETVFRKRLETLWILLLVGKLNRGIQFATIPDGLAVGGRFPGNPAGRLARIIEGSPKGLPRAGCESLLASSVEFPCSMVNRPLRGFSLLKLSLTPAVAVVLRIEADDQIVLSADCRVRGRHPHCNFDALPVVGVVLALWIVAPRVEVPFDRLG